MVRLGRRLFVNASIVSESNRRSLSPEDVAIGFAVWLTTYLPTWDPTVLPIS